MREVWVFYGDYGQRFENAARYECRAFEGVETFDQFAAGDCAYVPEPPIWAMEFVGIMTVLIVAKWRARK